MHDQAACMQVCCMSQWWPLPHPLSLVHPLLHAGTLLGLRQASSLQNPAFWKPQPPQTQHPHQQQQIQRPQRLP
jgi:hypothetical protein